MLSAFGHGFYDFWNYFFDWARIHLLDIAPLTFKVILMAIIKKENLPFENLYIELFFLSILLLHSCLKVEFSNGWYRPKKIIDAICKLIMLFSAIVYFVLSLYEFELLKGNVLEWNNVRLSGSLIALFSIILNFILEHGSEIKVK